MVDTNKEKTKMSHRQNVAIEYIDKYIPKSERTLRHEARNRKIASNVLRGTMGVVIAGMVVAGAAGGLAGCSNERAAETSNSTYRGDLAEIHDSEFVADKFDNNKYSLKDSREELSFSYLSVPEGDGLYIEKGAAIRVYPDIMNIEDNNKHTTMFENKKGEKLADTDTYVLCNNDANRFVGIKMSVLRQMFPGEKFSDDGSVDGYGWVDEDEVLIKDIVK
jgi:hypothetical protein